MKKSRAFTLIELLVVVAIIALLISILLPSLGKAKQKVRTASCLSNTRSMGLAAQFYIADWKTMMPFAGTNYVASWTQLLMNGGQTGTGSGYGATAKIRVCPEAPIPAGNLPAWSLTVTPSFGTAIMQWANSPESGPGITASYGINGWLYNTNGGDVTTLMEFSNHSSTNAGNQQLTSFFTAHNLRNESQIPVMADCNWRHIFPLAGDAAPLDLINPGPADVYVHPMERSVLNRHNKAVNVSFMDGHAETEKLPNLWTLRWTATWPYVVPPVIH